jgi:hypothetical protein
MIANNSQVEIKKIKKKKKKKHKVQKKPLILHGILQ